MKKARLKDEATLKRNGRPTSHATTLIAVKYPKFGKEKDFYMTFHKLSHEVSCTLITHPSLGNLFFKKNKKKNNFYLNFFIN